MPLSEIYYYFIIIFLLKRKAIASGQMPSSKGNTGDRRHFTVRHAWAAHLVHDIKYFVLCSLDSTHIYIF